MKRPAVFFDRDGVLNRDIGYAYLPDQIEWVDGAVESIRAANAAGYYVFVVTNQAGVARGLYTEQHIKDLHSWMAAELAKHGAKIDAFAYCPHHPDAGSGPLTRDCDCRKPKPGMLLELMARYDIDVAKSFLVGDKDSDVEAAQAAGVQGELFTGTGLLALVQKHLH